MGSLTDLSTPAQFQSELPGQFKSQKAAHFHRNIHLLLRVVHFRAICRYTFIGFYRYADGFKNAIEHELFEGFFVKIFNSAYFIATKLEAHKMRGGSDFRTSTDFEDIVFVLDNCPTLSNDLSSISDDLGQYLKVEFTNLLKHPDIKEGIYAHIEPRFAAHRSMKILELLESFVNSFE